MATKKHIFLSDRSVGWIKATTDDSAPKWSESINASLDHLRFLLKSSLPKLDEEEWQTLLNVYTGSYFPAHGQPARIASDMMDNLGEVDISAIEESNPGYAALVYKMHALNQTEQLAVLYVVQMFWNEDWSHFEGSLVDIISELENRF